MSNANLFGELLRSIRVEAKKTLKQLADDMTWSVVYLSDIERGKRNPPSDNDIKKISLSLGCSANKLLNMADTQRERVELDITSDNCDKTNAALMLARKWTDLTPEQAKEIINILEGSND